MARQPRAQSGTKALIDLLNGKLELIVRIDIVGLCSHALCGKTSAERSASMLRGRPQSGHSVRSHAESGSQRLQRYDIPLHFDFLQCNQLTVVASGTMFRSLFPCLRAGKVRVPERPGLALARPALIDLTGSALAVEENAVPIGKLYQAPADSNTPHISLFEFSGVQFQQRRHRIDFLLVDPDMARRPRAAVAALGALEAKTGVIPRCC